MLRILTSLCLFLCLFFCSPESFGQEAPYMDGEILVQIGKDESIRVIEKQWRDEVGQTTPLFKAELISEHNRIWLLEFDPQVIEHQRFLEMADDQPGILIAQNNHQVFLRDTLPNDPQIPQQWQYVNTGQDGGTSGADIDAELAWEMATGGLSPMGDTIVVAIVDDGFDWDHSDFEGNVWFNYDEIPGNNIDDDNNGYVDDYRGWSTIANSGNFNGGGHGTPVAGIVGAKGNNGLGVAGVNWDVKLMIIQGGTGVESEVIAAYSYALEQRIKYNETNGADGAFVVATNSSWGVDFGQPSNAPLWCAFYDTLGVNGILSCAATINGNQNVDVVGDLPTACSSDYLISVTNMNRFDEKVTSAGYGVNTIDLGAFGSQTWTTASGNSYGSFGGTSGATPHVTGTIALIYSMPCMGFNQLARESPSQAALQARDYIFNGVDPNESLENITSTEGRLNLHKTLLEAQTNCPEASACFGPFGFQIDSLTLDGAYLRWNTLESNIQTRYRFRELGSLTWEVDSTSFDQLSILNLLACTDYEIEFQSQCDTSDSAFGSNLVFQTDGCCENPNWNDFTVTDNSVDLSWQSVTAAITYDLRFKLTDEIGWTELNNVSSNQLLIDNLLPCEIYETQIRTNCENETLDWGPSNFIPTGCGTCTAANYCTSSGSDTDFEFIESLEIGDETLISGASEGFQSFLTNPISLEIDSTYQLAINTQFGANGPVDENYRIWIDFNQDGLFNPLSERAFFTSSATDQTPVLGEISIPANAVPGITRMRVVIRWANDGQPTPCGDFEFGEVEDYCVEITTPLLTSTANPVNRVFWVSVLENPFKDQFTLNIETTNTEEYQLSVYHAMGQLVHQQDLGLLSRGVHQIQISDLDDLPSGSYFLEIRTPNQHQSLKLIKTP